MIAGLFILLLNQDTCCPRGVGSGRVGSGRVGSDKHHDRKGQQESLFSVIADLPTTWLSTARSSSPGNGDGLLNLPAFLCVFIADDPFFRFTAGAFCFGFTASLSFSALLHAATSLHSASVFTCVIASLHVLVSEDVITPFTDS